GLHGDVDAAQQTPDAVLEAVDEVAAPRLPCRQVDCPLRGQPGWRQPTHHVRRVSDFDERLARDAADVQADTAQPGLAVSIDEHHRPAKLGCPDRGDVAAGTTAHDEQVDGLGNLSDDHG